MGEEPVKSGWTLDQKVSLCFEYTPAVGMDYADDLVPSGWLRKEVLDRVRRLRPNHPDLWGLAQETLLRCGGGRSPDFYEGVVTGLMLAMASSQRVMFTLEDHFYVPVARSVLLAQMHPFSEKVLRNRAEQQKLYRGEEKSE